MILRIREDGAIKDVPIGEGDILLLPPHVRHSPQRSADTIGMVIEMVRPKGALDAFEWYCEKCDALIHRSEFQLVSIVDDLVPAFEKYYASVAFRTCDGCGHLNPGDSKA